jgi:5-bromo-4-chloroindolyl phosphate hydrolysis protein
VEHYCWDEAMTTILVTVTVIILKYFFVKNTYPNFIANASTSQLTKISHGKYNNFQHTKTDTHACRKNLSHKHVKMTRFCVIFTRISVNF